MKTKVVFLTILVLILIKFPLAAWGGEIEDLRRDIVLLNLINGLYLDSLQTQQLLSILYETRMTRENYKEEMKQQEEMAKAVLTDLRKVLKENKEVSEDTAKRVHALNKMVEEIRLRFQKKLCLLESRVVSLLTDNQLYLIENFKPCLIPPKQGAIGQMPGQSLRGAEIILERVRRMPEWRFQIVKERLLAAHIDRLEQKFGVMSEEEKSAEKERVSAALGKARGLSEVDFVVQKSALAQEIIAYELQKPQRRKNELGKVGRFLLDERLIPILETRVKSLALSP